MTVTVDEETGSALLLDHPNSEGEANPFAGQQGQTAKKAITTMITSWTSKKFMAGWCVGLASPPVTFTTAQRPTIQRCHADGLDGWAAHSTLLRPGGLTSGQGAHSLSPTEF
jgi:hypothetical protein